MFHSLLISLLSSWYLSTFSLTLMSLGIAISIMAQLFPFLFTTTISGSLASISQSHWIITSHKIFTSSFSATSSRACSYHFLLHFLRISHTICNELFLQHYRAFSSSPFAPIFYIDWQYFLVKHRTKWWLDCFIYFCFTYFVRIVCSCVANSKFSVSNFVSAFLSQFHVPFSSVVSSISLTNWPYILLLFHSSFFSLIQLCLNYLLSTASLYSIVSAAFTPSVNGSIEFLTYHAKLLSSIVTLLSHFPTKTYPINITFGCHGLSQTFWSICLNFLIHLYSISGFLHLISLQKPPKY